MSLPRAACSPFSCPPACVRAGGHLRCGYLRTLPPDDDLAQPGGARGETSPSLFSLRHPTRGCRRCAVQLSPNQQPFTPLSRARGRRRRELYNRKGIGVAKLRAVYAAIWAEYERFRTSTRHSYRWIPRQRRLRRANTKGSRCAVWHPSLPLSAHAWLAHPLFARAGRVRAQSAGFAAAGAARLHAPESNAPQLTFSRAHSTLFPLDASSCRSGSRARAAPSCAGQW